MDPVQLELFEFVADKDEAWRLEQKRTEEIIGEIYRQKMKEHIIDILPQKK